MDDELRKKSEATNGVTPGLETAGAPGPLKENGQHASYWVLSEEERKKGFVRPVRHSYKHLVCGTVTSMSVAISETYARDPKYYGSTFCVECGTHTMVGPDGEFEWLDGTKVGT